MANITKEQVQKMNFKLENGFVFDVEYFFMNNEKTAHKMIRLKNGKVLEVQLLWYPEYKEKVTAYNQKYNDHTGRNIPTVWFTEWSKGSGTMMHSYGLGKYFSVGEAKDRMMFSELQKVSKEMTIENLKKFYSFDEE